MTNQLCWSTTCFGPEKNQDDLIKWIEMIVESGVDLIEISRKQHDIASRAERVKATGAVVHSIHGTLSGDTVSPDPIKRQAAITAEIGRMRDCAAFAPCPYVVHYLNRYIDPAYGVWFREAIEALAAANTGMIIAVETVPYKPEVNERYADSAEIAEFVRSFNSPEIQMTVDINHSNLNEDIFQVCRNTAGLIVNAHISDNHGIREEHLIPGEGIIPLREVMTELYACGYRGACNLELHIAGEITLARIKEINQQVNSILQKPLDK